MQWLNFTLIIKIIGALAFQKRGNCSLVDHHIPRESRKCASVKISAKFPEIYFTNY